MKTYMNKSIFGPFAQTYAKYASPIILRPRYFIPCTSCHFPVIHAFSQSLRATGSDGGFGCSHCATASPTVLTLGIMEKGYGGVRWWMELDLVSFFTVVCLMEGWESKVV